MEQERPLTTSDLAAARGARRGYEPDEADLDAEAAGERDQAPLFAAAQIDHYRGQWHDTQATFVDDPRQTVERADALVADLMQRLAEEFANARTSLEAQWDRGEDVSTEELRVALTRYRSFFERLLAA